MGDDGDRSDLWEEAWSRPAPPAEEPVRARPQWEPGEAGARRADRADSRAPRHSRRMTEIGGRDAHLTFEPPEEYRPDHVERHRDTSARGAAARDMTRKRREAGTAQAPRRPGPRPFLPSGVRMPRGTVVGYRRRFRGGAPLLVVAVLVIVAIVAALAWWLLTRPAALALTPSLSDAIVSIAGHGKGSGALTLDDLEPGTLIATVARSGFETATVEIEVARGGRTERAVALRPLPFKMKFTTRPAGAHVSVSCADGSVLSGTTPCSIVASAGPVSMTVSRTGSTTLKQSHTLVFSDFLDDRLRVYDVPAYATLAQGNGGRYAAQFAALKKTRA